MRAAPSGEGPKSRSRTRAGGCGLAASVDARAADALNAFTSRESEPLVTTMTPPPWGGGHGVVVHTGWPTLTATSVSSQASSAPAKQAKSRARGRRERTDSLCAERGGFVKRGSGFRSLRLATADF